MTGALGVPLAMNATAQKSIAADFNLNTRRTVFRVETTLIASGTPSAPVRFALRSEIEIK